MTVNKNDILKALKELGLSDGDVVLVHSSLKSPGYVEGGAETVIEAFLEALGKSGTLVMPTLSQRNFEHAYEEWSMDRPSDVGLITETFRKMPNVLRSDQETHSAAALGIHAKEITGSHKSFGPIYGVFGEYCFSYSSPWQKMYDLNGKTVFFGVDMTRNTFKHFVEYRFTEKLLNDIKDEAIREEQKLKLRFHGIENGKDVIRGNVWPYYNGLDMQNKLDGNGMIMKSVCGNAPLMCVNTKEACDFAYSCLLNEYSEWYSGEVLEWIEDCLKLSK